MEFAWPRGELRQVCSSDRLLRQRFGEAAAPVKLVLTVLMHCDSLREVRAFRAIQLFLLPPNSKHQGRLLIQHKEIDVTTELLSDDTTTVYDDKTDPGEWLDPVRALRIVSINRNA